MKLEKAINALKEKQAIISRTDDDHWLYEPIATVLEELKRLRKAYELACKNCLGCLDCEGQIDCSDKSCVECFKEYYLQKARENNDNS